jgi:hypothetical protein
MTELWILGAFLFGITGATILHSSSKPGMGFLLGAFLGPLGLIIAFVIRSDTANAERRNK